MKKDKILPRKMTRAIREYWPDANKIAKTHNISIEKVHHYYTLYIKEGHRYAEQKLVKWINFNPAITRDFSKIDLSKFQKITFMKGVTKC